MAITSLTARRVGSVTVVLAVSDLTDAVYFHWYLDGAYMGMTRNGRFSFSLAQDDQARVECVDTDDPEFNALDAAPANFAARYTIHWVRSLSDDVASYRVELSDDGFATAVEIATVAHVETRWDYSVLTPRLDDLTSYQFRVIPIDRAGNEAEPIDPQGGEYVVRVPDSPRWSYTYNPTNDRVTFAAA